MPTLPIRNPDARNREQSTVEPSRQVLDRGRRFEQYGWSGGKYQNLITTIVSENHQKVAEAVLTTDKARFQKNLGELSPKTSRGKQIILPDIRNVIRKSNTVIKAAEKGKLISETLRDRIKADVRQTLLENNVNTTRGTVRKDLAAQLSNKLRETFAGYTRKDPSLGMPPNIHAIAVTETRTVVNNARLEYVRAVARESDRIAVKTWVHNTSLSSKARRGHYLLDGTQIRLGEKFIIKDEHGRHYRADGPHDPNLPASEVVSCNCELAFSFIPAEQVEKSAVQRFYAAIANFDRVQKGSDWNEEDHPRASNGQFGSGGSSGGSDKTSDRAESKPTAPMKKGSPEYKETEDKIKDMAIRSAISGESMDGEHEKIHQKIVDDYRAKLHESVAPKLKELDDKIKDAEGKFNEEKQKLYEMQKRHEELESKLFDPGTETPEDENTDELSSEYDSLSEKLDAQEAKVDRLEERKDSLNERRDAITEKVNERADDFGWSKLQDILDKMNDDFQSKHEDKLSSYESLGDQLRQRIDRINSPGFDGDKQAALDRASRLREYLEQRLRREIGQ